MSHNDSTTFGARVLLAILAIILAAVFSLAGCSQAFGRGGGVQTSAAPPRDRHVLYTTAATAFVVTKALDVHSTKLAIDAGAREANPFLPSAWYVQAPIAAIGTVAILKMSGRLARTNRALATAILAAAATAYALIASHNYQLARTLR